MVQSPKQHDNIIYLTICKTKSIVHRDKTTLELTSFEAARSSTQLKRQKNVRGDDKQGRRKV